MPRTARFAFTRATLLGLVAATGALGGCTVTTEPEPTPPAGIPAGEVCVTPGTATVRVRFEPSFVAMAPGVRRQVEVVVDPDFCTDTALSFESDATDVVASPAQAVVSYGKPRIAFEVEGGALGDAIVTARVPRGDGTDAEATLAVHVLDDAPPACAAADDVPPTALAAGASVVAAGSLAGAGISLPAGSDKPNGGSFLWSVTPFAASLACAADLDIPGYLALGPAVTFGPEALHFKRDVPMSVPLNPARLPEAARWRHMRMAYRGPAFAAPRTVTVTDARVEQDAGGAWRVSFKAPRLGTYQAVVPEAAGTTSHTRRLTHRAVTGVSMGGGGSGMMGLRNHHLFDVVAPLGGPVEWTWLINHIEHNHTAGFRAIAPGTQLADIPLAKTPCTTDLDCASDETCLGVLASPPTSGKCTLLGHPEEPYVHPSTFNTWWAEYPRTGTGGSFPRDEYVQIFRDLALMYGNPSGDNPLPGAENLPAGVDPNDPSQVGDHPNGACKVWVDPIDGDPVQQEIANNCPVERCSHTLTLQNYFDDEYNPDGTFPVITFCDGSPQNWDLSPYANTWTDASNDFPMEVALAVDYNGNGKRDELEPVIRNGHEAWDDWGADQTPSALEPGYAPDNLDPAGDDYEPQYNPNGTEGNHRYDAGEKFYDYGLDGVPGTVASPYDKGEGDGEFTVARGLQHVWDWDSSSVVRRRTPSVPGGELDDTALGRLDLWTDGGTRDLFNFAESARQLAGSFAARGREVAQYASFVAPPGLDISNENAYDPSKIVWSDMPGVVMQRYGKDDPTAKEIEDGAGQHVGTVPEIASRLQSALYFIGSRWPDAPRARFSPSAENPAPGAPDCAVSPGNCLFDFTSSDGRTGPVVVSLPPGYAHKDLQDKRYPVIYMLHGYGQTPDDLQAAIVFLSNWMNAPTTSQASRLAKAILVYVDGRCRPNADGVAECIRGTFFTDSVRADGAHIESWWLELIDYIDANYRTMGETLVEQTD
ncbi:MAG: hypothetical protein IT373_35535 [Polyangiaceae bacterium]|nr:hypothetical protein [Polyangiaceae bacterium]